MLEMESVRAREKYGPRGRERERGRDSVPFGIGGWYPISCLSLLKPGEYKNEKGGSGGYREGGREGLSFLTFYCYVISLYH